MTIDERLEALAMNLELFSREVEALRAPVEGLITITETLLKLARQDGENIRELRTSIERLTTVV